MRDQYQREIDYLRVSVTDRCNFRCKYCMPQEGVKSCDHSEIMSFEEILKVITLCTQLGIHKIKITGGEPLVRKDIGVLLKEIGQIEEIQELTITTNGELLGDYLEQLQEAKVTGINVSLDSLNEKGFQWITGKNSFSRVWENITEAVKTDIPIKLNCVPLKGVNEAELFDFAELAKNNPITVRFIEMMPLGYGKKFEAIPGTYIKTLLEKKYGTLKPIKERLGNGPAKYYEGKEFLGKIGFINAVSHGFCHSCNRVRLTADGILKPCLQYESRTNLKELMRRNLTDEELKEVIRNSIYNKPKQHAFAKKMILTGGESRCMNGIGG